MVEKLGVRSGEEHLLPIHESGDTSGSRKKKPGGESGQGGSNIKIREELAEPLDFSLTHEKEELDEEEERLNRKGYKRPFETGENISTEEYEDFFDPTDRAPQPELTEKELEEEIYAPLPGENLYRPVKNYEENAKGEFYPEVSILEEEKRARNEYRKYLAWQKYMIKISDPKAKEMVLNMKDEIQNIKREMERIEGTAYALNDRQNKVRYELWDCERQLDNQALDENKKSELEKKYILLRNEIVDLDRLAFNKFKLKIAKQKKLSELARAFDNYLMRQLDKKLSEEEIENVAKDVGTELAFLRTPDTAHILSRRNLPENKKHKKTPFWKRVFGSKSDKPIVDKELLEFDPSHINSQLGMDLKEKNLKVGFVGTAGKKADEMFEEGATPNLVIHPHDLHETTDKDRKNFERKEKSIKTHQTKARQTMHPPIDKEKISKEIQEQYYNQVEEDLTNAEIAKINKELREHNN